VRASGADPQGEQKRNPPRSCSTRITARAHTRRPGFEHPVQDRNIRRSNAPARPAGARTGSSAYKLSRSCGRRCGEDCRQVRVQSVRAPRMIVDRERRVPPWPFVCRGITGFPSTPRALGAYNAAGSFVREPSKEVRGEKLSLGDEPRRARW